MLGFGESLPFNVLPLLVVFCPAQFLFCFVLFSGINIVQHMVEANAWGSLRYMCVCVCVCVCMGPYRWEFQSQLVFTLYITYIHINIQIYRYGPTTLNAFRCSSHWSKSIDSQVSFPTGSVCWLLTLGKDFRGVVLCKSCGFCFISLDF